MTADIRFLYTSARFLIAHVWDHLLFRARYHWKSLVKLFVFVVSLAFRSHSAVDWSSLAGLVSVAAATVSFVLLAFDVSKWMKLRQSVVLLRDPKFYVNAAKAKAAPPGWIVKRVRPEEVIAYDPRINVLLGSRRNFLEIANATYRLPDQLVNHLDVFLRDGRLDRNERKIRLCSDIDAAHIDAQSVLKVQPTEYFLSGITNQKAAFDLKYINRDEGVQENSIFSLPDLVFGARGALVPLESSRLSNHIGVTTVLVTSDNKIVLQRQTGYQHVDAGKMNVGASGSADWSDIASAQDEHDPRSGRSGKTLQGVVRHAMEREVKEELSAGVGAAVSRTTLTGYCRYIHRGGKPEFFGLTFVNQPFAKLKIRREEWRYVLTKEFRQLSDGSPEALVSGIKAVIAEFAPSKGVDASISLLVALEFARDYLEHAAPAMRELRPL